MCMRRKRTDKGKNQVYWGLAALHAILGIMASASTFTDTRRDEIQTLIKKLKDEEKKGKGTGHRFGTAPCPKHVFLKYFSIKAELLAADITADLGSKFCIR